MIDYAILSPAGFESVLDAWARSLNEPEGHMTDYTTLSGADFQREVGTDPIKWAEAFLQRHPPFKELPTHEDQVGYLAAWFADAMEAARKDSIREVLKREGE